jgi:hypothetical protein
MGQDECKFGKFVVSNFVRANLGENGEIREKFPKIHEQVQVLNNLKLYEMFNGIDHLSCRVEFDLQGRNFNF